MTALHVFDMDGTLLRGTSASLEIGRGIGRLPDIEEFEAASSAGTMDNVAFARACHPIWQTLTETDVDDAFAAAPWIGGIAEVWADIAERGERSAVVSMSPLFFVRRLLDWGAGSVHATDVPIGRPLDESLVLTTEAKVTIVESLLGEHGLEPHDCVAYGDSYTDTALFRAVPNTVAINADSRIRRLARVVYDGDDLRDAYGRGRMLLGARTLQEGTG
ncbi:HAD family hydrolase [Pseudonocardia endophytica]|uniref:Phosphoserine phosphatase n=1 Tax=Pseudonocardia endophytica TaxID=401976 RepID=A0A4R1HD05_PSEEN|nr:haloacid dehalogenase-like hydrolase [Pseudonocardia endophytica]TCK19917.1 phosphoserine phosphatase [Pseudonocardia endophytica]